MIKYISFYCTTLLMISCNNTTTDEIKTLQEKIIEQNAILEKQRKELTNETISHEKTNKNETYPSQDLTSNSYKTENKECLVLSFKFLDVTKREHRNIYKKLSEQSFVN